VFLLADVSDEIFNSGQRKVQLVDVITQKGGMMSIAVAKSHDSPISGDLSCPDFSLGVHVTAGHLHTIGSYMFQPGWPGFVKAKRVSPDDYSTMTVDKRDQSLYRVPTRKISISRTGQEDQEVSLRAGVLYSSDYGEFWKPVSEFLYVGQRPPDVVLGQSYARQSRLKSLETHFLRRTYGAVRVLTGMNVEIV